MIRRALFLFAAVLLLVAVANVKCENDDGPLHTAIIDALVAIARPQNVETELNPEDTPGWGKINKKQILSYLDRFG